MGNISKNDLLQANKMPDEYSDKLAKMIGRNIRKKRKEAGLSVYALAIKTGTDWSTLRNWETGANIQRYDRVTWMCKKMGWAVSEIYGRAKHAVGTGGGNAGA